MSEIAHKLGLRVQRLRKGRGLTQAGLAELANLAPHTISRIERGEQSPSLEALDRLAGALGVVLPVLVDVDGALSGSGGGDAVEQVLAALPADLDTMHERVRAALEALLGGR